VLSTLGNIFGGYNELDWSSNSQYGNTNNNFLFLLDNKKKIKMYQKKTKLKNLF